MSLEITWDINRFSVRNLIFPFSSVVSRFNGTSTECGSSFRCNNQWSQGFYPSTDCTTGTPHLHRHQYPPQYNQQFANGGNPIHFNCRSTVPPPHGRLQKSLSFAFQTPMMNDPHHQSYQNQLNSINYPEQSHSRWWTFDLLAKFLLLISLFVSTDVICTINRTSTAIPTRPEWILGAAACPKVWHIRTATFTGTTTVPSPRISIAATRGSPFKCSSKSRRLFDRKLIGETALFAFAFMLWKDLWRSRHKTSHSLIFF